MLGYLPPSQASRLNLIQTLNAPARFDLAGALCFYWAMTFAAFRRQTDRELEGRLCLADILLNYQAKPAEITRLVNSGHLASVPRRGGLWFAKDAVDAHFQPRRPVRG